MIGKEISHYRILEKLGGGGMGVVYKAQDLKLDRFVALKFLPHHLGADEEEKKRFIHEAKAASALDHPNICTIYEIGEAEDGQMFIAMACYEGETLKQKITRGQLAVDEATEIAVQIVLGLAKAHEHGIIHRDVKPANIFVTKDGIVKVVDFGVAKLAGQTKITKTGTTMGTAAYMSPEQARAEEVDHCTDIWALGVVLYEMLTGRLPFRGDYDAAIMYEILNVEPETLDTYRADVPENILILLSQLLQKDRTKRISSVKEIIDGLKNLTKSTAQSAPEKSIAVLYFENMSSEKESDYFCAGITEDIITDLSKIKGLRVVSRTDVLPFRNKEVNTSQVGKALRVNYILEGSVRKAGNKIRITAQLIDVCNGYNLWAERFDRLVDDIFDLQNEVSQRIVEALKISLTDSEKQSLSKKPTDDLRAYDFYMRGREYLYRKGKRNNDAAIQMFENAVAIDPGFASPYAGLAEAYLNMYEWYDGNPLWLGKAIEMNQKALNLDPTLVEARFEIAMVYFHQKRLREAKRMLEEILQENSQFYPACLRLGMISETSGDLDSALEYYRRASELKPYDEDAWRFLDGIYRKMGNVASAEEAARKVIEVTSRKLEASLDDVIVMSRLAEAYARFGAKEEAHATLKRVFEIDPNDGLALYNCCCAYALLGEKAKALLSLRRAFDSGFRAVANWAETDTAFDSLRSDPVFNRLIAELE